MLEEVPSFARPELGEDLGQRAVGAPHQVVDPRDDLGLRDPERLPEAEELLEDAAVVEDRHGEVEGTRFEVVVARHRRVAEDNLLDFRGGRRLAVDVVAPEAAGEDAEPGVVLEPLAAGVVAGFRPRQQDELERPDVLDAGVEHVEDRLAVLLLRVGRQPEDDLGERSGVARRRVLRHLDDGVEADVRALDLAQDLGVGGLNRRAQLQQVPEDPRHLDDAVLLVLGCRRHDVARPAAAPPRVREHLRRVQVAGEHPPVEVGQLHRRGLDPRLDVGQLLAHAVGRERARLVHVQDAVVAERARVRAAARRLNHRRQLVVEELVHQPHRVGRRQVLVELQHARQEFAADELTLVQVVHARQDRAVGLQPIAVEVDRLECLEQAHEGHLALAVHVEVDLRPLLEVPPLLEDVERVVRTAHDNDRVGVALLDRPGECATQSAVPHVVREAGDRRRLLAQKLRQCCWILEQVRVQRLSQLHFGVRRNVADGQRGVVGVDCDPGMSQVQQT